MTSITYVRAMHTISLRPKLQFKKTITFKDRKDKHPPHATEYILF